MSRNAAGSCHGNKCRGRIFWNCFAGCPALCSKVRLAMAICTKANGIGPGSSQKVVRQTVLHFQIPVALLVGHRLFMKFTLVLEPERAGYSIHCPALPACVSQGHTREEAMANIREVIEGILALREKHDMPLPEETLELVSQEIRWRLNKRKTDGLHS